MADEKQLNEDELFTFVEYSPEAAERIGYSDYSYWKSVFKNFLKKKAAVVPQHHLFRACDLLLYRSGDREV